MDRTKLQALSLAVADLQKQRQDELSAEVAELTKELNSKERRALQLMVQGAAVMNEPDQVAMAAPAGGFSRRA